MLIPILKDVFWFILNGVAFYYGCHWLRQAFGPVWVSISENKYAPHSLFLRLAFSFLLFILTLMCFREGVSQMEKWLLLLS